MSTTGNDGSRHGRVIDLRSDTVTKPTPAMLEAMMSAEVGDDVYGEDPSVNALQEEVAALLGKEAALYVPTGTMANQIALNVHTRPGDEVIAHPLAHIVRAEGGAGAALSSIQFRTLGNPDGSLPTEAVAEAIYRGDNPHNATTALICMENTANIVGGTVLSLEQIAAVAAPAREQGVPMHLDGARVLNAAAVLDVKPERITGAFASTTLCFSKGLGAPAGSVVAGSRGFIDRCLRVRKRFGGSMRQSGYLAAAARYALKHNVTRLAEDHANARRLAEGMVATGQIEMIYGMPQTNIVFFRSIHPKLDTARLVAKLKERGVLAGAMGPATARAVTHLDVSEESIDTAVNICGEILASA